MNYRVKNKKSINDIALSFECQNNIEFLHIVEREREREKERERERERESLLIDSLALNKFCNVSFKSPC